MAVHEQSVIPRRLEDYWPSAYQALTEKEHYCYTESQKGGVEEYRPFFQDLASQIDFWFNASRTEAVRELMERAFVYVLFGHNYGTRTNLLDRANAYALFDIKGFLRSVSQTSEDYYDDFIPEQITTSSTGRGESTTSVEPARAPRLQEATERVANNITSENGDVHALADDMSSSTRNFSFRMLFEEPPATRAHISQEQIGRILFEEYNWAEAFDKLNINLDKPSYIG